MNNLESFVVALSNYDLFDQRQIVENGLRFFVAISEHDFDKAEEYQNNFYDAILLCDLEGTRDLVDPVMQTPLK
jgi:hypothetical protein